MEQYSNSQDTAEENTENESQEQLDQADIIKQTGSVRSQNAKHLIHCLNIIGQIEGHDILPSQTKTTKYEHILPALVAIEQDRSIEGLLIILNTVGGDVEAGLAIAEMIAGMKTPTVSLVVGGGHSIGVPLAVSAKLSMIVPSASMTLHPVRTNGMVLGVPQSMEYLRQIEKRITGFITSHSNISEENLTELMHNTQALTTDLGTIINGTEASEIGLIDETGSLHDALERLYSMIENTDMRYPDNLNQDSGF
ncbi:MAG: ATP-dependent Clp protease proteolytic subunit [Ruminococcus sp.]|nr:ATP-dependent Clp protease proteolytic subunit [Ruminococcus sp.]